MNFRNNIWGDGSEFQICNKTGSQERCVWLPYEDFAPFYTGPLAQRKKYSQLDLGICTLSGEQATKLGPRFHTSPRFRGIWIKGFGLPHYTDRGQQQNIVRIQVWILNTPKVWGFSDPGFSFGVSYYSTALSKSTWHLLNISYHIIARFAIHPHLDQSKVLWMRLANRHVQHHGT